MHNSGIVPIDDDSINDYIPTDSDIALIKDYYHNTGINFNTDGLETARNWRERVLSFGEDKCTAAVCESHKSEVPLVSVIIPVYNLEKYVEKCLNSILTQSLKEFEIICVDDGSTDNSLEILKQYAQKDTRISVYTQKNAGQSFCRNFAVEKAKGEFIYFIDGDDYLVNDTVLETLYKTATEDKLDLLFFKSESFCEDDCTIVQNNNQKPVPNGIMSGTQMLCKLKNSGAYRVVVWIQFVRRSHYIENNLYFVRGIIHEDNAYTLKNLLTAKRVEYIDKVLYVHRFRNNSSYTSKTTFYNAYCEYLAYLDMKKTLDENAGTLNIEQYFTVCELIRSRLNSARRKYASLDDAEKACVLFLPLKLQENFADEVCSAAKISELNCTLKRTYEEKSEINRKLQITYKEKAQRGEEIKRLKAENEKLKNEIKGNQKSAVQKIKSKISRTLKSNK